MACEIGYRWTAVMCIWHGKLTLSLTSVNLSLWEYFSLLETTVDRILFKYKSVTQTTPTRFDVFFSFILKRLLKKQSSYLSFETPSPFLNPKYMLDYLFVWFLLIKVSCWGLCAISHGDRLCDGCFVGTITKSPYARNIHMWSSMQLQISW